jgi:hypothetical protein
VSLNYQWQVFIFEARVVTDIESIICIFCRFLGVEAPMLRLILKRWILASALAAGLAAPGISAPSHAYYQRPKGPDGWQRGEKRRPVPDWLDATAKRLDDARSTSQPGPDVEFLFSRAVDLLERARLARDNPFRSGRFLGATNALLDAGDRILWSRKTERGPQEQDYWDAGFVLQACYFRIRQSGFFAPLSGEKNAEQYVTLSRSLYQQARGAYDAHEFQRARLLGDASSFIVFALERIAQASAPIPEHPIHK